jgi:hypothetical protein
MMDNNSYNLIMALASNLESYEAYHKYAKDGNQQLWEEAAHHTEQIVSLLMNALPQALQTINSGTQTTQNQGQLAQQGQMQQPKGVYSLGDDYAAGPTNPDLNNTQADGVASLEDSQGVGTNQRGVETYEEESQMHHAEAIADPDIQKMGYRSGEGSQRY